MQAQCSSLWLKRSHTLYAMPTEQRCDSCGEPGVFQSRCSNGCAVHHDCMANWAALMTRIGGCSACRADKPEPDTPSERERSPAPSGADKYMEDSKDFYKAYKKRGGKCSFDAFTELLRAFFEHTLNSHVWGERSETSQKEGGLWLHPSRGAAEAAWAEQTGQTPQEFGRVFDAVDSVHAYT